MDEAGYLCDQWVGDNCDDAFPGWASSGYTQAGENLVLRLYFSERVWGGVGGCVLASELEVSAVGLVVWVLECLCVCDLVSTRAAWYS